MPVSTEFRFPVIDAHIHLPLGDGRGHNWFPFTRSRADYFRYLEQVGVRTFVGFPHGPKKSGEPLADSLKRTNDLMLKFWRRKPGLVIPAAKAHPSEAAESIRQMQLARREGVVFVGEFVTYGGSSVRYDDLGFEAICEAANELGMILNCHLVEREEEPFEKLLRKYRKASFVLAHLWDNRELVKGKCALVKRNRNALVDLSGYGVDRLGIWKYVVETVGAEKVLWGSDYPINDPAIYLARLATCRIKAAEKRKVAGGNVLRMLKERGAPLPK